jgi:hypothetical protein
MRNYKNCFRDTLIALLCGVTLFASCEESEPKSAACDIVLFSVDALTWTINGTDISRTYPPETPEVPFTPTIVLSPGATVNPSAGVAQNFFTAQGVAYTVTAEDGVTSKIYKVKAIRTPYSECDIVSFVVDGVEWEINDSLITYAYTKDKPATPLTPVITLSPGAKLNPPASEAQNFFTEQGVRYTVTSENGATTKTYIARARQMSSDCEIVSFRAGNVDWNINEPFITYTFSTETSQTYLQPVITLSPGATVNPPSGVGQNFFTDSGVEYTVTSEDGSATKTYIAKATLIVSGVTGACTWTLSHDRDTLTISGNGTMANYSGANDLPPWDRHNSSIKVIIINEGVTAIGDRAFMGSPDVDMYNNITSVTVPNSVTTIGYAAFAYWGRLSSVTLGNMLTTIGEFAFYSCHDLTSITIPNSVKTIRRAAFDYCSGLTSVTIGNSVETIGEYAFFSCGLTSVTIPGSVTKIEGQAFGYCTGLTVVVNLRYIPQNIGGNSVFNGITVSALTLRVPSGSVDAYKDAAEWNEFGNIEAI